MINRREFGRALAASTAGSFLSLGAFDKVLAQTARDAAIRVVWPFDTSSLDPVGIGVQRSTWAVSIHVYDRLVSYAVIDEASGTRRYDPNRLAPELAEKWDVSPDGRSITFHLRKGATFHDGSPVTAEDARWSIARALSVPAAAGVMRVGGISSPDQLAVIDDQTLKVTLSAPNRYSIAVFSIPFAAIINKKLAVANATEQDPWATEWLRRNAAGGGAFKMASFRSDQVVLTRNDAWTGGPQPAQQQVIFQTVPEATTRIALVERASADVAIEIPPADFAGVTQRGTANAVAIAMPNHMDFVAFNSQTAPFNDIRVRQAVACALPYDQIFRNVFGGRGAPLFGGKGGPEGGVFPQAHAFAYDQERARALLKDAGLASGFETSLGYSAGKAGYFDPLSLAVRDALGQVGIRVNIERLPGAQFDERVAKRTLPMLLENRVAWLSQPDYWLRVFYSGTSTSNLGNYQSAALGEMLGKLKGDAGPQEYAAQTRDMIKLVLTEVPMVPIRQGAFEVVLARSLTGYTYWFHGLPDARSMRRASA